MRKHSLTPVARALLATSALYLATLPTVHAADATTGTSLRGLDFSVVDANRDGYVDSKEAAAAPELSGIMSSADKDRDGKLSASEFRAGTSASPNAPRPSMEDDNTKKPIGNTSN